jgi:hypothetical protein
MIEFLFGAVIVAVVVWAIQPGAFKRNIRIAILAAAAVPLVVLAAVLVFNRYRYDRDESVEQPRARYVAPTRPADPWCPYPWCK